MIQKRQLFFHSLSRFLLKKIAANAANTSYITGSLDAQPQPGEPDVMWQSVVFIAGTGIWTNGVLFSASSGSDAAITDERLERMLADSLLQTDIQSLATQLKECQVAFFQSILPSGTLIQQSAAAESTPTDVYFFTDAATFGFVPSASTGVSAAQPQYYTNWPNRAIYADDQFHPYASKLYFCIQQRKLYVWDGTTLQPVGGTEIQVDDTLSPTSTNPVQNKVVTQALGTKFAAAAFVQGDLILYADTAKTVELGRITLGATSYVLSQGCDHESGFYVLTGESRHIVSLSPSTLSSAFGSQNTFIENYTVSVQSQSGTGSWTTRISDVTIQSGHTYSFDIRPWIGIGANTLRISVTGQSSNANTTLDYELTLTALTLEHRFSWWRAWVEGSSYSVDGLYFYGNLQKTLHVLIDDQVEWTQGFPAATNYNTSAYSLNISARQPSTGSWTPTTGIHTIEVWIEGGGARTSSYKWNVMVVSAADAATAKLVVINNAKPVARNYTSETSLFQFATYNTSQIVADLRATDGDQQFVLSDHATLGGLTTQTVNDYPISLAMDSYVQTDAFRLTAVLSTPTGHSDSHTFPVDNSESFAPTSGATAYFNFASRSNAEADRSVFRNIASGASTQSYPATFTNFAWANDGYAIDADGNMGLKVPAGSRVEVSQLRALASAQTSSMTLEFMFRASNIADYDTPLLSFMSTNTYSAGESIGMMLFPTQIKILSSSERRHTFQSYNLSEDDILHVTVVWQRSYAGLNQNLCRVYINSCPVLHFEYSGTATWTGQYSYLRLGQPSTDLMLYMMRIYTKALEPSDVLANFLNALIETNDYSRAGLRNDNAIVDGGAISYELAKQRGFNCYVIETDENLPSFTNQDPLSSVNLRFEYADHPEWNVRIVGIPMDGQGTTSMQYYRWNLRNKIKSSTTRWEYPNLTDGSGSMLVETGKDGYIAGHGLHPKVAKITAKKNVASSSQGHKMGATNLYNDLWHRFFDANLGATHYLPSADTRVAVYQNPFLGFRMTSDGFYEFIGLYTIGPDKTDKKTFGYNKTDDYPSLMMIEGPNHAPRMTRFLCPWTSDVEYSSTAEHLECGGEEGWDADIAAGYSTDEADDAASILSLFESEFKPAYDLIFFTSPYIRPLSATGKTIAEINADIESFWRGSTSGYNNSLLTLYDSSYNLYYYRIKTKQFEPLGVNIRTFLGLSGTPTEAQIQSACQTKFKNEIGNYVSVEEAKFHYCFRELIGATDNDAKNSYWRKFKTLASGGRWGLNQDDLDTILRTDNNGQNTKSYSIEPGDRTDNGDEIFQGDSSAFWERLRLAYDNTSNTDSMNIRSTMMKLIGYMDEIASDLGITGASLNERVFKVISHYFWDSSSKYFPAIAYAEDTEWTYLTPWLEDHTKTYNSVEPLTQASGTQYNAEIIWVQRRIAYIFSKYRIGGFGSAVSDYGLLAFTPARNNTASLSLVPAIDLYPRTSEGGDAPTKGARTLAGEACVITPSSDGNTTNYILGLNWYSYIGDLSQFVLTNRSTETSITFSISAQRLRELKVGGTGTVLFNAEALYVSSPALERLDARNVVSLQGTQDLTQCPRLREVLLEGTSVAEPKLPIGGKLQLVHLPASVTTLMLHSLPLLYTSNLSIDGYANIASLYINNCAHINPFVIMRQCFAAGSTLKYLTMIWSGEASGQSSDIETLARMAAAPYNPDTGAGYGSTVYDSATGSLTNVGDSPVIEGIMRVSNGSATREVLQVVAAAFPNLTILGISQFFIHFADAEVLRVLLARGYGDGTGITEAQAAAVTTFGKTDDPSVSIFYTNATVTSFDEFRYFTGMRSLVQGTFRSCTSLRSVTFPAGLVGVWDRTFQDCTSLTSVTLPSTLAALTENYDVFNGCTSLVSVTLPAAWTHIGHQMFAGCTSLDMAIPSHVTSLGYRAFAASGIRAGKLLSASDGTSIYEHCPRLTTCTFYEGITSILEMMFWDCPQLDLASLPATLTSIGRYAFCGCTSLSLASLPSGLTSLGDLTFAYCTSLALTALPTGLTAIPDHCFDQCSSMRLTALPDAVSSVGSYAFWNAGLSASRWPSDWTATSIPDHAFGHTDVAFTSLPASVTEIGAEAFVGCLMLTSFVFHNAITAIGAGAFKGCTSFNTAALPSSLSEIANNVFDQCTQLTLAALPSGITRIGEWAFSGSKVQFSSLPSGLTEIAEGAFYRATALRLATLPDSLRIIGASAFAHSRGGDPEDVSLGLTALLPKDLTHIGRDAFVGSHITKAILWDALEECISPLQQINTLTEVFMVQNANGFNELDGKFAYGCNALSEVDLPSNITSIGDMAFFRESGTPIPIFRLRATTPPALGITPFVTGQVVQVPSSALEAYQTDEAWAALIDAGTITIQAIDITAITHYYLRRGLTSYGATLFDGWSSLSRVNSENEGELAIGSAVTSIANYAIRGTSIVRVTSANATALTSVIFSNASKLKVIDLSGCTKLRTVGQNFLSALSALETIILPHGLTSVGSQSFRSAGASKCTYVRLPDTVTSIASLAFSCTSATTFNYVDFGNTRTTVPSLNNSSAFTYSGNKNIIIPDALYDNGAWAAATNWSNSTIVPKLKRYSDFKAAHPELPWRDSHGALIDD